MQIVQAHVANMQYENTRYCSLLLRDFRDFVLINCFNMDFLKSAVASAISKDPPFPYKFGDRLSVDQSIWALHNGTKRVCVLQDNMDVYS